ncbi:ligand-dependent nuclear receptor-interacting factor 1 [Mantella aurantiaca]
MSKYQNLVMSPMQSASSNQSLTGCMYQIVQSPGAQGKNILQLIPVLNAKDNPGTVGSSPVITNSPVMNVQQPVRFSLPPVAPNVALPCPVNAQLVQQLGSSNYIITTQKNPAEASKTIRIDGKLLPHQNAVKPPLSLPTNPHTGAPSFIIMNTKPAAGVPVKTIPIFPPGHGLQIPAHAEVKSVPASSLPFSIQQRILPPNTGNDTTKMPSVIYVSPVNTVKTTPNSPKSNNVTVNTTVQSPRLTPLLVPAAQSGGTTPTKGPLKWVVQENTESLVPVRSNNETASKILTFMSGAKTEELNLPGHGSPNLTKIKDNSLVMCNNKIYFLTKQSPEFQSLIHVKQETPEKAPLQVEQGKDLANKVVEVLLSKNSLSPPNTKQTVNTGSAPPPLHADAASPAKPKASTPAQTSKNIPEVIYIDDDDDDEVVAASVQKPPNVSHFQPNKSSPAAVCTPSAAPGCGSHSSNNQAYSAARSQFPEATPPPLRHSIGQSHSESLQRCIVSEDVRGPATTQSIGERRAPANERGVKVQEAEVPGNSRSPACRVTDDRTLRAKFGLLKNEKIILSRIPLLHPESKSPVRSANIDVAICAESPEKRKSPVSDSPNLWKRRKSEDSSDFMITSVTTDHSGKFFASPSVTPLPPPAAGFSDTRHVTPGDRTMTEPNVAYGNPSTSRSYQDSGPDIYADPTGGHSFYAGQDITGHYSETPVPRQRFHIESSVYPDETTKDEKIQRLKEVLKEREQALEVLRRQKWS